MFSPGRVFVARCVIRLCLHIGIVLVLMVSQGGALFSAIPVTATELSSTVTTPAGAPAGLEAAREVGGAVYGPSLPAGVASASTPAPLQSTSPGIRVYEQSNVDCANPQYSEISLPYEAHSGSQALIKYLYVCVDGEGSAQLTLHAEALGVGAATLASFKCRSGCSGFTTVQPTAEILWSNVSGNCRHRRQRADSTITVLPGKYTLVLSANNTGDILCKGVSYFNYIYADLRGDITPRTYGSGGGGADGGCDYNDYTGNGLDPVNTFSGNFTYQFTDFSLPSRGLPLVFERSYNSRDTYPGPLGQGWTHNYNTQLWFETGRVVWLSTRGARLGFTDNGDGSFTPETGIRATLAFTQNTYTLTQGDNLVYTFNQTGTLTSLSTGLGHTTALSYTGGLLTGIQGEDGRALTLTYDDHRRIQTIQDPISRTAMFTYTYNTLTAYQDPSGQVWTYTYDGSRLTALAAPNGGVLSHGYDAQMRVITQTNPLSATSTLAYAPGLTTIYDANGRVTQHHYDANGALTGVTDASGHTLTYTRDANQNIIGVADAAARTVSLEWNAHACSPAVITDTLGHVTQMSYDDHNQLTAVQDALGRTTQYGYDGHRLITITDALGGTVIHTYDAHNLRVQTVERGLTTTFGYDAFGQVTAITDTLGRVTRYGYDAVGRLITTTNPAGQVTVNEYDARDNLLRVTAHYTTAGGQNYLGLYNQVTTYAYSAADLWGQSRRTWMTDTHGRVTRYEYDLAGDLLRVTANYSASVGENHLGMWNLVTQYAYDAGDANAVRRQTSITDTNGLVTHNAYDALGRLASVTAHYSPTVGQNAQGMWNRVTQYAYTTADPTSLGQRTHITDTLGNVTYTEYDALNRAVRTWQNYLPGYPQNYQNTYNRVTEYGYDAVGNQVLVTDTLGNVTYTEYDALNRVARTWQNYLPGYAQNYQDTYNRATTYGYDAAGRQTLITDTLGIVTYTEYDAAGRVIRTWQNYLPGYLQNYYLPPSGGNEGGHYNRVTAYSYDEMGRTVLVTDTLGHATYTGYDALGRAVTTTANFVDGVYDPARPDEDRSTLTVHNAVGQVAARVQLSGTERITTTYAYDALDRVITTTNALGHTSVTDYDAAGRRAASRDALGHQTTYTYDAVGQLLATTGALGNVTTYTYDALGRRTAVANALNHTTTTLYDAAGRVAAQIDALNGVTQYTYDALGRRTAVTDPGGVTTYSGYDAAGRLSYTQDALGHATVYTYDALGRQRFVTDAQSQVTRHAYDAAGRLSAVTVNYVPGGPEDAQTNLRTSYTYNALGAYTHVTDPLNHTTVYTYDGAGRLSAQQDALGYVTSYEYDALGRRVSVTTPDAAGPQTTLTHYDVLGRVVRVDYPANGDAAAFSVYHAYDALGRRSALTDPTGVTTWTYDALGRMTGVSDPFTGTVAYSYDDAGNRTALTVTLPSSELRITNYEFDAANRLISVSDWATGTTTYAYDAAGRILMTTLPNGVTGVYDYDAAGRQVGLRHEGITGTLATYTYTLDALGRQVAVAESLRAGGGLTVTTRVIDHTFDGAGRLTHSAYSTGEAFAYQYDAAGNRTVVTSTTPLSGTVVTTNSYDAANRLTARSRSDGHAYTYDWSQRGQLLTEWTQGYPVRAFAYDGAGRMIQARVFTQTTEFVYNGFGARLAVSVAGYGTTRYTLDYAANSRILAETTPTSTVSYLYGHECLGEQRNDEWLYYLHDAEGYVRQGADMTGAIVSAWLFDPDGTVLEGPNGPVSHLICGGVYDWSTGLIYRGGRYFDPNLGIWLALTPLLVVQSWRKRKDKRQWVLLVCVGLFVVGSLAGCCLNPPSVPTPMPTPTPTCTDDGSGGLGPGTGTPTLISIEIVSVEDIQVFPVPEWGGDWRVQFGNRTDSASDPNMLPGIVIEAKFEALTGVNGTIEWVQDVVSKRIVERTDAFVKLTGEPQRSAYGDGKRALDTWDPYKSADNFVVDSGGVFSSRMWDSPGMPLPLLPPLKCATIEDSFRSFVMWRPAGLDCRLPLGMIEWEWRVEIENTETEEEVPHVASWVKISQSIPKVGTQGGKTDQVPTLSPNTKDFKWHPIP